MSRAIVSRWQAAMRIPCHETGAIGSMPVVGIVVLHWGAREATEACLESFRKATYTAVRVFLVDNARSLDATIAGFALLRSRSFALRATSDSRRGAIWESRPPSTRGSTTFFS
jgi:hypothetical protein